MSLLHPLKVEIRPFLTGKTYWQSPTDPRLTLIEEDGNWYPPFDFIAPIENLLTSEVLNDLQKDGFTVGAQDRVFIDVNSSYIKKKLKKERSRYRKTVATITHLSSEEDLPYIQQMVNSLDPHHVEAFDCSMQDSMPYFTRLLKSGNGHAWVAHYKSIPVGIMLAVFEDDEVLHSMINFGTSREYQIGKQLQVESTMKAKELGFSYVNIGGAYLSYKLEWGQPQSPVPMFNKRTSK